MKKSIIALAFVFMALYVGAQEVEESSFFIQAGPTFLKKVIIPHLEAGVRFGYNQISFIGETYDHQKNRWDVVGDNGRVKKSKVDLNRVWNGGVNYGRRLPTGLFSALSIIPNVTAGVAIDDDVMFRYAGGINLEYTISKHFAFVGVANFPVIQNKRYDYKYHGIQTGILLQYSIF